MNNFKKIALATSLGLALLASSAFAADDSGKAYGQLNLGWNAKHSKYKALTDVLPGFKYSKAKFAFGAAVGYQFNANVRTDLSYTNLGKAKYTSGGNKLSLSGYTVLVNGYYDFTSVSDSFVPYVTVGAGLGKMKFSTSGNGISFTSKSKNKLAYQAGFGVSTKINEQISADLGYRFTQIKLGKNSANANKFNSNLLMLGVRVSF